MPNPVQIEANSDKKDLVSLRELSKRSGWSERRIRSLISNNEIRHIRIGSSIFLPTDAIQEFVQTNMVVPTQADDRARQNG
jgi:excisionase family DNA binding protein